MTADNARLVELLDRLETLLRDIREELRRDPPGGPSAATDKAVEAFADEAFRARDA